MSFTTTVKDALNHVLERVNLRVETLTAVRRESARIAALRQALYFQRPAFPLLNGMFEFDTGWLAQLGARYEHDLKSLMSGRSQPGGFNPNNTFYTSPDAEILYLMVRSLRPRRILEIGSGNSTKVVRQAVVDGQIAVEHVAIDPAPRVDVAKLVDRVLLARLEEADVASFVKTLETNDILFIDSSHEVCVANDVVKLFLSIIPQLRSGVVVHVHDIFLPFDYPHPFSPRVPSWSEQYLLQAHLSGRKDEILWPGFYLQMERPEEFAALKFLGAGRAQSFWFRVNNEGRVDERI